MSVFAKATASRSARAAWTGVALAGVSALLLTACSSGAPAPAESEEPTEAAGDALPVEAGERDLTLKVGTILPQSGTLAFLGPPEEAGVALAAKEINEADMGLTIEVVYRDSGDTTTDIATVSVTDLLSQDVSAIVGAASSGVSFTVIDQITSAGVVEFSPANTSDQFTTYNDSGLYFRTAPPDVLQAVPLADLVLSDGNTTVGILNLNDAYGTGLAKNVASNLVDGGLNEDDILSITYDPTASSYDTEVQQMVEFGPDAIVVIGFDESARIIQEMNAQGIGPAR